MNGVDARLVGEEKSFVRRIMGIGYCSSISALCLESLGHMIWMLFNCRDVHYIKLLFFLKV